MNPLLLLCLFLLTPLSAKDLLQNPDFSVQPATRDWTTMDVEVLDGPDNQSAISFPRPGRPFLTQDFAETASDFTLETVFQCVDFSADIALRLSIQAKHRDIIDLCVSRGGQLRVCKEGFGYDPLVSLEGEPLPTHLAGKQNIKLRVVARHIGTPEANYDLFWTESYRVGTEAPEFTSAARSITTFANSYAFEAPAAAVRVQRNVLWGDVFSLSQLSAKDEIDTPDLSATHTLPSSAENKIVSISGVYPHLAIGDSYGECGIGAIVRWADRLWMVNYGPSNPKGGHDRLFEITPDLQRITRPESIGGTHANRMIHKATQQLVIGPYFIDAQRKVRVLHLRDHPEETVMGRLTGVGEHLRDPNRLYIFAMENGLYDIDARDLSYVLRYPDIQVNGDRMLAGDHGKGAYTGQGRFVVSNNGRVVNRNGPSGPSGVLAMWDGRTVEEVGGNYRADRDQNQEDPVDDPVPARPEYLAGWDQIVKIQHTEVTGPGGIRGNENPDSDPVWALGYDDKSILLHVMENREWSLWRLPKGSYTHDGTSGVFTEWPRIRQVNPDEADSPYLMHMHGLFYSFPKAFSSGNFAGLQPLSNYHKMPVDYTTFFDGRIVIAKNDTSLFVNPLAKKAQSNLWFGTLEDIKNWGNPNGVGAVWQEEAVGAGDLSVPFLIGGFPQRTLHLRNAGEKAISLEIQASQGTQEWAAVRSVEVPAQGYHWEILNDVDAPWVRLKAAGDSPEVTAFFHISTPYSHERSGEFDALADIADEQAVSDGIVRVVDDSSLSLEFYTSHTDADGQVSPSHRYLRIGGDMALREENRPIAEADLAESAATSRIFETDRKQTLTLGSDEASAFIQVSEGPTLRLPRLHPRYDQPFGGGWARFVREVVTERNLMNCYGSFYEFPRDTAGGIRKMRVLSTHGKRITDFASWRGLFVLTGVKDSAPASDHIVKTDDGSAALWLGEIDDLWRMGEPRGHGGPWKDSQVSADEVSDPYLMDGYDRKELKLTSSVDAKVTVEVDFLADDEWSTYQVFSLKPGETLTHVFPEGFHAHWVRLRSDTATTATAQFVYGPTD